MVSRIEAEASTAATCWRKTVVIDPASGDVRPVDLERGWLPSVDPTAQLRHLLAGPSRRTDRRPDARRRSALYRRLDEPRPVADRRRGRGSGTPADVRRTPGPRLRGGVHRAGRGRIAGRRSGLRDHRRDDRPSEPPRRRISDDAAAAPRRHRPRTPMADRRRRASGSPSRRSGSDRGASVQPAADGDRGTVRDGTAARGQRPDTATGSCAGRRTAMPTLSGRPSRAPSCAARSSSTQRPRRRADRRHARRSRPGQSIVRSRGPAGRLGRPARGRRRRAVGLGLGRARPGLGQARAGSTRWRPCRPTEPRGEAVAAILDPDLTGRSREPGERQEAP